MLSNKHIRALKRINKNKVIRVDKNNKDLDYLFTEGLIEIIVCDKPGDYYAQPYLTEKGKAKLDEHRRQRQEVWIPVAISNILALVAVVISIIALLK